MVSCLGCLQEPPNTLLACGHGFCSDCIRDLTNNEPLPHYLQHIFCPLDRAPQAFSPRLLPVQSGYRILSLDGGGVKGLAQLVMLRHIEQKCFDVPVIYLFDLVVGTSLGGQIGLALTMGKSSEFLTVAAAKDEFPNLMRRTFAAKFPPLPNLNVLLNKTKYKTTQLESELIDFFGEKKLYSVSTSSQWSVPNVAVTTTVLDPIEARLVTN
jgi:predicted acylesterase/phospholipase RssA